MANTLPPAASLTTTNPPAIRLEVEAGAETSLDDAWERLQDIPHPGPDDWALLIAAERQSRMAWLAVEQAGGHRRKSKSLAALMQGTGAEPKPKTTRKSKKRQAKKTPATDSSESVQQEPATSP